jgi:hypothetical protein
VPERHDGVVARPTLDRAVEARRAEVDALPLFSVLWALAAIWHLLGNPLTASPGTQLLLVAGAGVVLWRPGTVGPLVVLALGGIATMWSEAPLLGNHWLLVALVDLALLVAVAVGVVRRRWNDAADLAERFLPVARWCLLGFYVFASFAKLNSGFFDRTVSCATFYYRESTDSLGLSALQLGGAAGLEWALIVGTVVIELSIPWLLLIRRTRHAAVVLALVFHAVLALDRTHQFYDFSSVLAPLFLLFLPSTSGVWVSERVGSIRARLLLRDRRAPELVHAALVTFAVLAGLAVVFDIFTLRQALLVGWWPWQVCAVMLIVGTVRYLRQGAPAPTNRPLRIGHPVFLLVPLLVVANGFTPYLEVKTGFGWNMYANLRTADGETNHLIVPRTLPLTDVQDEMVEIVSSDDAGLQYYADHGYSLSWLQLRGYLADHPETRLTYRRGSLTVARQRASDDPELVRARPLWQEKLLLFRAVDQHEPERCQPTFGPAR